MYLHGIGMNRTGRDFTRDSHGHHLSVSDQSYFWETLKFIYVATCMYCKSL